MQYPVRRPVGSLEVSRETCKQREKDGLTACVHTLSPASLLAGAITRRTQELNGVDADMAIRIAALTKVAFKGKLPPQPPPEQPYTEEYD